MQRLLPLLALCAGLSACAESSGPAEPGRIPVLAGNGGAGASSTTRTVTVRDGSYSPATLTIAVFDTVTWVWSGTRSHSVTFADGSGSGVRASGTFQRFFGLAGTFTYSSTVPADSQMRGTIVVR